MPRLAFQVAPDSDLGELARDRQEQRAEGRTTEWHYTRRRPMHRLEDPKGTLLEIFSDYDFPEDQRNPVGSFLSSSWVMSRIAATTSSRWLNSIPRRSVSGFPIGAQIGLPSCAARWTTIQINFVTDEQQRLHHIAFEVKDYAEIHRACDHLAKNDLRLVWGPGRHNIGHNVAIYHMNPDRVRVEIFAEMDQVKDEVWVISIPGLGTAIDPQRPKVWGPETLRNYWGPGSERDLYKNL